MLKTAKNPFDTVDKILFQPCLLYEEGIDKVEGGCMPEMAPFYLNLRLYMQGEPFHEKCLYFLFPYNQLLLFLRKQYQVIHIAHIKRAFNRVLYKSIQYIKIDIRKKTGGKVPYGQPLFRRHLEKGFVRRHLIQDCRIAFKYIIIYTIMENDTIDQIKKGIVFRMHFFCKHPFKYTEQYILIYAHEKGTDIELEEICGLVFVSCDLEHEPLKPFHGRMCAFAFS